jgi:F420-non-reducing hydrogenase iron-sulfur subunit
MTVKRITFLQALLAFMGLGDRVHLAWISSAEAQKFARVAADFTEHIRALGPNPLKALDVDHLPGAPAVTGGTPGQADMGGCKTGR